MKNLMSQLELLKKRYNNISNALHQETSTTKAMRLQFLLSDIVKESNKLQDQILEKQKEILYVK